MKYCTQCGERQTEGARFCSGCGVPLAKPADADDNDASSPPATAAAPQPPPPPPYAHYPAPPPPPYAGYPGGAPGVPPVDLGAEYSALYLQHYHAALAAITAQQQQQYAQGHYAGAYPGGYPAYDPHAAHPHGATAAPGAPPPPPPPCREVLRRARVEPTRIFMLHKGRRYLLSRGAVLASRSDQSPTKRPPSPPRRRPTLRRPRRRPPCPRPRRRAHPWTRAISPSPRRRRRHPRRRRRRPPPAPPPRP